MAVWRGVAAGLVVLVGACGMAWGSASLLVEQPYGELAHFN
jgi:hypothetical protein